MTQMYADDTVIYVHAKRRQQVAYKLTAALSAISNWLEHSCLTLNISKTACMYFSIKRKEVHQPNIIVQSVKLQVVSDFKYLGVVIDSQLTF